MANVFDWRVTEKNFKSECIFFPNMSYSYIFDSNFTSTT